MQVCAQFETTRSLVSKAFQRKHRGACKAQKQDANHGLPCARGACQRPAACKFPPLTFESSEGDAACSPDVLDRAGRHAQHPHSRCENSRLPHDSIQAASSRSGEETPPVPAEPAAFSPPDIGTPEPPAGRWGCSSAPAPGTAPCGPAEAAAVLVADTPQELYGVRVTWRQRPRVLQYLRQRGRLSSADIMVRRDAGLCGR
ncbi:RAD9, HUS1, RAD1-interacting nuclear orphan protein 1 [Aix galericulata]|nr:RAD9, HUS1, RAD1-interacting nuclear orphan protein 1 [Aix galericulata]